MTSELSTTLITLGLLFLTVFHPTTLIFLGAGLAAIGLAITATSVWLAAGASLCGLYAVTMSVVSGLRGRFI